MEPAAAPVEGSPDRARRADPALGSLAGLGVLWGALMLVFQAHMESNAFLRIEWLSPEDVRHQHEMLRAVQPHIALMQPFSMNAWDTSRREALRNVASFLDLRIDEATLSRISTEATNLSFDHARLDHVLHALIDDERLGFSLEGRRLRLFDQRLRRPPAGPDSRSLDWEAELALNSAWLMIVPTADSDLRLALRLPGRIEGADRMGEMLEVEIWRGTSQISAARTVLDANGNARVSLSSEDRFELSVRRVGPDEGGGMRFRVKLFHGAAAAGASDWPTAAVARERAPLAGRHADCVRGWVEYA